MAEHGYHVLMEEDVTAKKVTITPPTAPARGKASLEATHVPGNRTRDLSAAVKGSVLEIELPRWARKGNVLHWTSYEG